MSRCVRVDNRELPEDHGENYTANYEASGAEFTAHSLCGRQRLQAVEPRGGDDAGREDYARCIRLIAPSVAKPMANTMTLAGSGMTDTAKRSISSLSPV